MNNNGNLPSDKKEQLKNIYFMLNPTVGRDTLE